MIHMGVDYLDYAGISELTGIKPHVLRKYQAEANKRRAEGTPKPGDMPAPDARFSGAPAWKRKTIERWIERRPGRGVGGAEARERYRAERRTQAS